MCSERCFERIIATSASTVSGRIYTTTWSAVLNGVVKVKYTSICIAHNV